MSLQDADMVCIKADLSCNLGGGQGGGVRGNCSGTERYFHQCFLWKRLLKKMLGERWEAKRRGKERVRKAKDEKYFSHCSQLRSFFDR